MIFDKEGQFLDAWGEIGGEHYFTFPHGLSVGQRRLRLYGRQPGPHGAQVDEATAGTS